MDGPPPLSDVELPDDVAGCCDSGENMTDDVRARLRAVFLEALDVRLDTELVVDLSSFTSALDLLADRHALVGE